MLQVKEISFSYQDDLVLENISYSLNKGRNLALIGESGCGKSTLLKLIYGLYDLNEGQIFWNEDEVLGPKFHLIPGMPYMKYLAQDFDLMPFITVAENVGKYLSNFFPEEKQLRIAELLEVVEMTEYANVKAKFLSGGQMQRVALARVLALEPEVLLLDEPFSHIDNFRKNSLRRKLFGYLKEKQITCIVATHDSTDVLAFADEVAIIKDGKIIESGIPNFIYNNPQNLYVASLFGDVNEIFVEGKVHFVYPHQLKVVLNSEIKTEVLNAYFRGSHYLIEASFENQTLFFENEVALQSGEIVCLKIK
ncbi:ABC transporter ATP-binding protein [Flavobacterium channae]|uniref:ABC transporter ATP-binding protein n=1 Tax=Flavobacterium channae TaxID=2897181 RepID=UPI001E4E882A|nr:ABC transporter ATP-binding protein [Flavobacterium channae]UGS24264.1 ABC transporter ATP-binding protein [Flavobacterium channae]